MPTQAYLHTLPAITLQNANDQQKPLLEQAVKQVGFIPNMYANMVNAPAVLSTYLHGYGQFRQESGLSPVEQEVVFLTVSLRNGCDYCAAAHSMIADKVSGVPADVLKALRHGQPVPVPRLQALRTLTEELLASRGHPSPEAVRAFLDAGFEERQVLYIVLAIAVKTLSNFSNHAFGTTLDDRFSAYELVR